jgi:hypothetical protein
VVSHGRRILPTLILDQRVLWFYILVKRNFVALWERGGVKVHVSSSIRHTVAEIGQKFEPSSAQLMTICQVSEKVLFHSYL